MKKTFLLVMLLGTATVLFAQEAKYEIKSAILKKEAVGMGQKVEGMLYFDDYGKKESSELTLKMGTMEKHVRTLADGDNIISIDLDMKMANKVPIPIKPVNYLNLTDEVRKLHKIKEVGTEEIAGRPCTKYTLEVKYGGQTSYSTVWIWKGIPLKNETSVNGMLVISEQATEIQENVDISADKLIVPEGVVVP